MRLITLLLATPLSLAPVAAAELLMFERPGCPWCLRFDQEVAPKLPASPEGRRAPLRRVDLSSRLPADLAGLDPVRYTPTFVLIDNGREVGRIVGYQGEHFFWPRLGALVARLPATTN